MEKLNLRIDPDALTIGDLEDFEEGVGVALHEALKPVVVLDDDGNKVVDEKGRPETTVKVSAKALRYLVWIIGRQSNPAFTVTDARNVKVGALEIVAGDEDAGKDDSGEPV